MSYNRFDSDASCRLTEMFYTDSNNIAGDNLIKYMLEDIIEFIKNSQEISPDQKSAMETDLREMPRELIQQLYLRIIHDAKVSTEVFWEEKLQHYIDGRGAPPPEKYAEAKGNRTPIQFLEDVWGPFIDRGVLYQDVLTDYDEKLIPAIYRYWNRHGKSENDRIPPPRQERTDAIIRRLVAYSPYSTATLAHVALALQKRELRGQSR